MFSTGFFSGEQTERLAHPLLLWLFQGLPISVAKAVNSWIRTTGHLVEFGVLAILWYRSLAWGIRGWHPRSALLAFGLTILFAVVDEGHQAFVATRFAKITDVGLDGLGALGGLALSGLLLGGAGDSRKAHAPEGPPPRRFETSAKD